MIAFACEALAPPAPAQAQIAPPPQLGREGLEETRPRLPEFKPEAPPAFELPPVPHPLERDRRLSSGVRVLVEDYRFAGNSVFSDAELALIAAPYTSRAITTEDLLELRDALTLAYVERGYVNSGAVIPDQEVEDGVILIEIVEGMLEEVVVSGLQTLSPVFVEDRIRLGAGPPLDVDELRERIQLLLADPAIDRVNARLGPGRRLGESRLELDVTEAPPYRTELRLSNDRSPSIGAEGGELEVTFGNLFGRSDPFRFEVELSEGLRGFEIGYSVPVTPSDVRLFAAGEIATSAVVEEPFSVIDVESDSRSVQVGVSVPLIRTVDDELRFDFSLQRARSITYLLGRRFSFSEGVQDGQSDVTALRFVQQWQHRSIDQVIALRSIESLGIDALGATSNPGGVPDGQFFAWLGQAQWARRLNAADWQVSLRADVQLTPDPLLPIERVAIGGFDTVRGYRENQLVLDNGWVASVELRVPIGRLAIPGVSREPGDGALQLVPFVDAGGGWNVNGEEPDPDMIYSIGTGLRWQPNAHISTRLDFGLPLADAPEPEDENLQDLGLYFEIRAALY